MQIVMTPADSQFVVDGLLEFQRTVRDLLIESRRRRDLHQVNRATAADTIYEIDTLVEPVLEDFCRNWAKKTPLVLIAEGIEDETGREGVRVFPPGTPADKAELRVIVDPIDGTRGLMYDKRAAWALAGVAPNKGDATRLSDIAIAVMTELPTAKMGRADVLWAVKGGGTRGQRVDLSSGATAPLAMRPSAADNINHGFAMVSNFFPGTKTLAAEVMEELVAHLIGPADVSRATVFDDQYISTGGQFYELIVGHDRFNADLRPFFYKIQKQPQGMCCHPYDCATLLIAQEAGVIVTDALGNPLDGPLDVTTGITWAAYANPALRAKIEPLLTDLLKRRLGAA
jgi:fructose-1,6-bisphosphatase/inositol monophosphatase family enzyme